MTTGPSCHGDFQGYHSDLKHMPRYIIERELPEAGNLTSEQFQAIAQKSCDVLRQMGPEIQWLESYVTDNRIYCVYIASSEALIREHAQ